MTGSFGMIPVPKYRILHEHTTQDVYYIDAPDEPRALAALDNPDTSIGIHDRIACIEELAAFPAGVIHTEVATTHPPPRPAPPQGEGLTRLPHGTVLRCLLAHDVPGRERIDAGTIGIITQTASQVEVVWEPNRHAWYAPGRLAGVATALLTPSRDAEPPT